MSSGRGRGRGGAADAGREAAAAAKEPLQRRKAGLLAKDLPRMMYGFGDVETPLPETVALVEEMVCDYVTGLMTAATERANLRHGKAMADDVVAVMSKADPAKAARARELLTANEELHRAQKIIHGDDRELERMG